MRKRSLFKIIVMMLVFILLFVGLFLFSEKIYKLEFIESIKKAINEKVIDEDEENITIVDVTNISMQDGFNHECVLFTKYNEQEHWKECSLCGKKQEKENHSFVDGGWTMGNTCNNNNFHKFSCECGYSKMTQDGKIKCNMVRINWTGNCLGGYVCSVCNTESVNYPRHECISRGNGRRISCINLGICSICGYNYNNSNTSHNLVYSGNISTEREGYCSNCKTYLGKIKYAYIERQSDSVYKFHFKIIVPSNYIYSNIINWSNIGSNTTIVPSISRNGVEYTSTTTITINKKTEKIGYVQLGVNGKLGNLQCTINVASSVEIKADTVPPTITDISKQDLTEWSKTKPITITGTENYCSTVKVKIVEVDNEENVIFEGKTNVNSKNYSISCTPNVEVGVSGKTYKCIVTDNLENATEKIFEIAKVDSVPPVPTSENSVSSEWAREKLFTFCSTDYGIGEVEIAFNDENDYQLATENEIDFTRKYKFIGDVYSPKQAVALYKDGLGNVSSKEITLDKLDNTAPTITNVEIHNNKLKVTSNDIHKTLGEGSGVTKYRYLASMEKLNNPELTLENSIEVRKYDEIIIPDVYKMKYVYVVAEDLVRKYRKCI